MAANDGEGPSTTAGGRSYTAALALVLLVAILAPISTRFPPLHDYPNHLARTYILAHLGAVPAFADAYRADWRPYPNLAIDVAMLGLLRVFDPLTAGRVFLGAVLGLLVLGADRLARALHGRRSFAAPLAAYFLFNAFVCYGFVNYLAGTGVFLLAMAAWLRAVRASPASPSPPSAGRLLLATAAVLAGYLAHKTALAFFVVAAVAWLLAERPRPRWPALVAAAVPLVPPLALELFGGIPRGEGPLRWDGLGGKAKGLAMLVSAYRPHTDALLGMVFVAAILWLVVRRFRRGERVASAPGMLAAVGLFAAFLLAPSEADGGWAVDRRFLLPAGLVGLCALELAPRTRLDRGLWLAALAVVVVRGVDVAATWRTLGADLQQRVALLEAVPRGVPVFGFARVDRTDKRQWTRQMGLPYVHQYAAVLRDDPVNGLFAHANQQPLRLRIDPVIKGAGAGQPPRTPLEWAAVFARHRYVIGSRLDDRDRAFLAGHCALVAQRGDSAVFGPCTLVRTGSGRGR